MTYKPATFKEAKEVCDGCDETKAVVEFHTVHRSDHMLLCTSCLEEMLDISKQPPEPDWHDRPTCPGLYCSYNIATDYAMTGFFSQEEIDARHVARGNSNWRYYGPLPECPDGQCE